MNIFGKVWVPCSVIKTVRTSIYDKIMKNRFLTTKFFLGSAKGPTKLSSKYLMNLTFHSQNFAKFAILLHFKKYRFSVVGLYWAENTFQNCTEFCNYLKFTTRVKISTNNSIVNATSLSCNDFFLDFGLSINEFVNLAHWTSLQSVCDCISPHYHGSTLICIFLPPFKV